MLRHSRQAHYVEVSAFRCNAFLKGGARRLCYFLFVSGKGLVSGEVKIVGQPRIRNFADGEQRLSSAAAILVLAAAPAAVEDKYLILT